MALKEPQSRGSGQERRKGLGLGTRSHLPLSPTGTCKLSLTQATPALGILLSCKGCDTNSPQTQPGIIG